MPTISRYLQWTQDELNQMKQLDKVDLLVVHHTESHDVPIEEVNAWHKNNGWVGCGYHYLIRASGSIEKGRPDNKMGAHALGYNDRSLGISLCGDFTNVPPMPGQMDALEDLLTALRAQYPDAKVVRHRDLCPTSCPGNSFPWDELMQRLEGGNNVVPVTIKIADKEIAGQLDGDISTAPVRAIVEAMGGTVAWDDATKSVTVTPPNQYDLYAENQRLRQILKQLAGITAPFMLNQGA